MHFLRSLPVWDEGAWRRVGAFAYALIILLLSIQLPWILRIFWIVFSGFSGWLFFAHDIKDTGRRTDGPWFRIFLVLAFAVLCFTRVVLFIRYHPYPALGYDMGIYKYEFERAQDLASALKTTFYPGLILLVSLMRHLGFTVAFLMREFYIFLNLLIGAVLYWTGRQFFGKRAAFFALILYVTSITQFNAYYFFLYKNVLALSLLLATLIFLKRHSYWAILTGVYLGMVQPPDFLILEVAMVSTFLIVWRHPKTGPYLLKTGGAIAALFLIGFFSRFNQIIEGIHLIINNKQHWDPSISGGGVFIHFDQYLQQAIYYIPPALMGVILSIRQRTKAPENHYLHFGLLAATVIVVFKLIFFKRYLIEMDLFLILFAGLGASALYENFGQKLWQKGVWLILGLCLLFNIALEAWQTYPLLPPLEAARIGTLCKLSKNALLMTTDSFYSPWLRGYSCHETIAPGLFELNRWNYEGWNGFWSGKKELVLARMKELAVYRKPIYLFIGELQPKMNFSGFDGFTQLQSYLWRWDFKRD